MSTSEAVSDFVSSLSDLKTTNKANISMLTILADDDKRFAPEITKVIENRLQEAPPPEKLPVLYLIDSIVKNLPETPYRQLFSEHIVNNFVNVFAQVDDKTRGAMYKVRQTWCDIFSAKKLFVLDVKVNKVDPKWPIMPLPPDDVTKQHAPPVTKPPGTHIQPPPSVASSVPVVEVSAPVAQPPLSSFTNESILAKEEELRRLREMHLEIQLQKQKLLIEKQKEELARIEQAKELQQRLALLVEQVKSVPLPESAQKLLLETVSSTLSTAQGQQQTSSTGSSSLATSTALPRDPRKRHAPEPQTSAPTSAKSEDVIGQLVQNLQEAARCLKPAEGNNNNNNVHDDASVAGNGRPKHAADIDGSTMSPGGTRRIAKRPLEPKDTSLPAVKSAKSDNATDGVTAMVVDEAVEEEESDAEFKAAVDAFREISSEQPALPHHIEPPYPKKSALKQTGHAPFTASQPQPLEPVQPLKPPGSATSLPPGPGPMPSMSEVSSSKLPQPVPSSSAAGMAEKDHMRLLDEAERQLNSGQLTTAQHGDLVNRLTQLYEIQRKIKDVRGNHQQTQPHKPAGEGEVTAPPHHPPPPVSAPSESGNVPLLQGPPGAGPFPGGPQQFPGPPPNDSHRPHQPPLLPTPPSAENKGGTQLLQPASFPSTAHVVLNGEPIDMTIGGPPRTIFVAGKRRVIRINAQSRHILMDGRPVYKLNSALRETMVDGCRCMIFYHGEMQSIWINAVEYRIRVDAPPQSVIVDGQPIELVVDTGAGEICVNGERACAIANLPCDVPLPPSGNRYRFSFHAPVRQIQIDNQFCEVKLDLPVPAVLINGELRGIRFDGPPRVLLIDDEPFEIHTDRAVPLKFGREDPPLNIQLGAPAQELIIGDHRYNIGFGTGPVFLMVNNKKFKVELPGHTPEVKLLGLIDAVTGQLLTPAMPMPQMPMPPPMPMPPFGNPVPPYGPPGMPLPPPPIPPPGFDFRLFPPSQMAAIQAHHSGSYAQPSPPAEPMPPVQLPPPPLPPIGVPPGASTGSVDINDLISKLMNKGMLPIPAGGGGPAPALPGLPNVPPPPIAKPADIKGKPELFETPDLTEFNMDMFKIKYASELKRLYGGVQCGSCGCRFSSPESSRYRLHLDWHFRVNKREREAVRILRHRAWFLPVLDWISLEQSAEPDQSLGVNESSMMINVGASEGGPGSGGSGSNSQGGHQRFSEAPHHPSSETLGSSETSGFDGRPNQLGLPGEGGGGSGKSGGGDMGDSGEGGAQSVVSCPAASDTKKDTCVVCGEGFETFWNEELDEWHLKDAVCVAGKTYHTVCFEDAARTSVASTPSSPTFPPSTPLIGGSTSNNNNSDPKNESENNNNNNNNSTTNGIPISTTPPPPGALIVDNSDDTSGVKIEPVSCCVKMEATTVDGTGDETSS